MGRNLILLALSVLCGGTIMELALRQIYEPPPVWREPQIRHLRSPLLGWVLPPSHEGSFSLDAPIRTNALGLRDDEIPETKPPGETRILGLGDSFTFALAIRFEDLWVQQLERQLNEDAGSRRFQVINAGVAGYNSRQELIYLLARGFDLDPDLVVVAFYWNDLVGNEEPLPDLASTPLYSDEIHPPDLQHHTLPKGLRDALRRSLVVYLGVTRAKALAYGRRPPSTALERVQHALLSGDEATLEPFWTATAARLREIAAAGAGRSVPVVLLHLPMEEQIRRPGSGIALGGRLVELWRPTGWPAVDLEPLYRAALGRGENPFLPYDLHPNEVGMRIAAEALHRALLESGLVVHSRR
jgi:lysophospholipase L1-like esterase